MPVLLLRCVAPMQSWGTRSRFDERDTDLEPSKSGVIGLLCAALGVPRENTERTLELAALRLGVRVDAPGILRTDYQTAQMRPGHPKTDTVQTWRQYLSDAAFLVALEGKDRNLLERTNVALRNPFYPISMGRKSYPPGLPVWLENAIIDESLEQALRIYPNITDLEPNSEVEKGQRFVIETHTKTGSLRFDQPISSFAERRFGTRHVITGGL
jgi:CRISPR system Cascade subunit CasD